MFIRARLPGSQRQSLFENPSYMKLGFDFASSFVFRTLLHFGLVTENIRGRRNLRVLQMCKTSRCFRSTIYPCLVTGGLSELSTCGGSQQFVLNVQQPCASPNFSYSPTGTRNAWNVVDFFGNVIQTVSLIASFITSHQILQTAT